jgi:aspartyl-tRNA(Asn)/glutamyl-tRNA(Gln) amidotransferase subunit A
MRYENSPTPVPPFPDDKLIMTTSSRDRLEQAFARINDPAGEGSRTCLTVYADAARKAADAADARAKSGSVLGPLDGVVFTIKDLFDVEGEVTRAGSIVLTPRNKPATKDAAIVKRLRDAGAVIVAKTNMTEFAYSGLGANPHYGTPGNPADRSRVPGGSSSGAGVAVADDMCEIAIGTDTGGSVRIPAGFCGVVGFKPTVKRVSREGAFPLSFTLDSIGPLAKSVAECAATDAVIADETPAPLETREIGSIRAGFAQGLPIEGLDEIVGKTYPQALAKLSSKWKSGKDVTLSALSKMHAINQRGGIAPPEAFAIHRDLLKEAAEDFDPNVRARLLRSKDITAADYILNMRDRAIAIAEMDKVFDEVDVLVMPTTQIVAPTLQEISVEETYLKRNVQALRNTSIWNFFDVCGVSLPMNFGNALPCGLMLIGRHGNDRALLAMAAAVEKALAA